MYIGIIAKLNGEKKGLAVRIGKIDHTIELLRELDGPSELSRPEPPDPIEQPDPEKPPRRKYNTRKIKKEKPQHIAGLRGPRKKASKFKGVSRDGPRKDGSRKWRAQYWDGKKQKPVSLGMFETELLAAAAYQDHDGNKAEAARLRSLDSGQSGRSQQKADIAEQADNNPDREKVKIVTIYICSHCNTEWNSKPDRCPHCDSASFKAKKVPADSV